MKYALLCGQAGKYCITNLFFLMGLALYLADDLPVPYPVPDDCLTHGRTVTPEILVLDEIHGDSNKLLLLQICLCYLSDHLETVKTLL